MALAPGTRLGPYEIVAAIGAGGMGEVYKATDTRLSRTVAIKRLHPQFAQDKDVAGMLLDEARFAARIQHPNVVPTLDVVATDDQMLLVMEYVRGDSLSRLLRAAQLEEVGVDVYPMPYADVLYRTASYAGAGSHGSVLAE